MADERQVAADRLDAHPLGLLRAQGIDGGGVVGEAHHVVLVRLRRDSDQTAVSFEDEEFLDKVSRGGRSSAL